MTLKRILLLVLCLSLVTGFALAKVIHQGTDTLYVIPRLAVAPVIDGQPERVWDAIDANWQTSYANGANLPNSWEDLSGWSKMGYDDSFLYGIFYAQDDAITNTATLSWERDAIEFYIDGDNTKINGPSVTAPDYQFTVQHALKDAPTDLGHGFVYAVGDEAAATAPSGYYLEFKIPLDSLGIAPIEGSKVGLEWQQDDNDDGLVRRAISKWHLQAGDDSWQFASHWGTGILGPAAEPVDSMFYLSRTSATITLDGALDAAYDGVNQVTQNYRGNGAEYPVSGQDMFWRFYGAYDDNNMYGLVSVYDNVVTNTATLSWERDAVEVYLDGDNTKVNGPSLSGNDYQFTVQHALKDAPTTFTHGFEYAIQDVTVADTTIYPCSGYNMEFRIPLDSLGIAPIEGSLVGFEVQADDNDDGLVRKNVTKWWLQSGDDSWQFASHWGTMKLGIATAIKEQPKQVVSRFDLAQNYPNPFNPSTTITYTVTKSDKVRLTVYNVLGVKVADLVNGVKAAGTYNVTFNASNLASGVYFYKLETGNNVMSKKMMLLK